MKVMGRMKEGESVVPTACLPTRFKACCLFWYMLLHSGAYTSKHNLQCGKLR